MKGFLKCYYGYKNRGDELLFFGVLKYLFTTYTLTHLYVEVGDVCFMRQWLGKNHDFFAEYQDRVALIDKKLTDKYDLSNRIMFFGGGEVLTDEIEIHNEKDRSENKQRVYDKVVDSNVVPTNPSQDQDVVDISHLDDLPTVDTINDMVDKVEQSQMSQWLQSTFHRSKRIASKYFARSGRNYYLKYYSFFQSGQVVLLGGITTPHKITTKLLYKLMLPKCKEIVCRDTQSADIAKQYVDKKKVNVYDDFGRKFIEQYDTHFSAKEKKKNIKKIGFNPNKPYVLINVHRKIWNNETKQHILDFCATYSKHQYVYFPADIHHDTVFFEELQQEISDLVMYDWTCQSLSTTLSIFQEATAGIGARLHFLIPLQEFDVPFQPLVYAEKVKKLVLDKMEPLKLLKENKKGSTYQAQDFKVCYRNKGSVSGNNNTSPQKYIYLISGKAEVTAEDEVKEYAAPCFFCIPAKTYHKIEAKTDLSFVLMEK